MRGARRVPRLIERGLGRIVDRDRGAAVPPRFTATRLMLAVVRDDADFAAGERRVVLDAVDQRVAARASSKNSLSSATIDRLGAG